MSREEYVRKLLEAYRTTPGTTGHIRRPDRVLAAALQQRGVSLQVVENALVLAASRRLMHSPEDRGSAGRGGRTGLLQLPPVSAEAAFSQHGQDASRPLNHRALRSQRAADQAFGLG